MESEAINFKKLFGDFELLKVFKVFKIKFYLRLRKSVSSLKLLLLLPFIAFKTKNEPSSYQLSICEICAQTVV